MSKKTPEQMVAERRYVQNRFRGLNHSKILSKSSFRVFDFSKKGSPVRNELSIFLSSQEKKKVYRRLTFLVIFLLSLRRREKTMST